MDQATAADTAARFTEAAIFGLTFVTILFLYFWLDERNGHALKRWQRLIKWYKDRYFVMSLGNIDDDESNADRVQNWPQNQGSEPRTEPQNPIEPAVQSRTALRPGSFVLEPEELVGVARMILHKCSAERPTKASTIEAGFGVKKGDSAKYKRASLLYDMFFVIPPTEKYRPLTDTQELTRQNLQLSR